MSNIHLIPTRPGMGRALVNHDDASKNYPARALIDATKPRDRHWRRGTAYDQGQTSECVAYCGKGILNSRPLSALVDYDIRRKYSFEAFYHGAQVNDEWPGENYEGTSGLGLLRYLKSIGLIEEYRWNFSLNDTLLSLSHLGPIGLGIMWTNDMFEPDSNGYIQPTGGEAGGHEIEMLGIDVSERYVELENSWGPYWGFNGRCRMTWPNLEILLGNEGDSFVITR